MKKSRLKSVSDKRKIQLREEAKLRRILLSRSNGRCEICHEFPDWRGLSKHEKLSRARGGDALDPKNTLLLCGRCHTKETFDVWELDASPIWSKRKDPRD